MSTASSILNNQTHTKGFPVRSTTARADRVKQQPNPNNPNRYAVVMIECDVVTRVLERDLSLDGAVAFVEGYDGGDDTSHAAIVSASACGERILK
jgi:hypothetical protein